MFVQLDFFKSKNDPKLTVDIKGSGYYKEGVKKLVSTLLPHNLFFEDSVDFYVLEKRKAYLNEHSPIIKWSALSSDSLTLSIALICHYRQNAGSFFYDMVSRWLLPGRYLNVELFFASDFVLKGLENERLTVAEVLVKLQNVKELYEVRNNIRSLESEIRLGITSDYHANKIIEFKGLSQDKKTALIQDKIGSLIQARSKDFGKSIFSQMQHFLVTCHDEFKNQRDYHHISRIISNLHSTRKLLKQKIEMQPQQRHLMLKFLKAKINKGNVQKNVLGVLVGLNFLKEHEIFEKNHLFKAIEKFIPNIKCVENSFFVDRYNKNIIQTLYLEIEKENGEEVSFDEIKSLRIDLPNYLKDHIEYLMHPVFMPRNEEEIVRNMMTLSKQLKYKDDIPQVIISFDKQSGTELSFMIIMLRLVNNKTSSVQEMFQKKSTVLKFIPDRVKNIGLLRRRYAKEANVFRVLLPSTAYLREDHSVDLKKAREDVFSQLQKMFGTIRDYNGGMLSKQNESLDELKIALGEIAKKESLLLEKFFYAIKPVEMTVIGKDDTLKGLFLMLLNSIRKKTKSLEGKNYLIFRKETKVLSVLIPFVNNEIKKKILKLLEKFTLSSAEKLSFSLQVHDVSYLGYAFFVSEVDRQQSILNGIQQALDF
jgi:hypothetical protein